MSQSQKPRFTFTWQYYNFSMCPLDHSDFDSSPIFVVQFLRHSEWLLVFYPKGDEKHRNALSCYLYCVSAGTNTNAIQIDFTITIYSHDSKRQVTKEVKNHVFQTNHDYGFGDLMTTADFVSNKEAYLPNDTLTIKCTIWSSDVSGDSPSAFADHAITIGTELDTQFIGAWNDCSAATRVEVQNKNISWAIENFNSISFDERQSLLVSSAVNMAPSIKITLYKSFANQSVEIEIEMYDKSEPQQTFFKCKVSVLNPSKVIKYATEDVHLFLADVDDVWRPPSFIQLEKLQEDKYFNNTSNALHLRFEFSYSRVDDVHHIEKVSFHQYGPFVTFSEPIEEFRNLYKKGEMYDVVIRAGNKYFKVLKSILGARSPVFGAMFDMKEKDLSVVYNITEFEKSADIPSGRTVEEVDDILKVPLASAKFKKGTLVVRVGDVEADTLDRMLTFIYSNALEDLQSGDAIKLYLAADKYQVLSLKIRCSCVLAYCMSVSNVCEVLVLADQHGDEFLRDCAENFIRANSIEVFNSEEWSNLIENKGTIAANVMLKMLTC